MEIYQIKNLSFTYPNRDTKTLNNINLSVNSGEFILLCGKSGCGKTTLLRLLKSSLSPFGNQSGEIIYKGLAINEIQPILFKLLKANICECRDDEKYVFGLNSYVIFATLAGIYLDSPDGRKDIYSISRNYMAK